MSAPHMFGATAEREITLTSESLSDPVECQKLQACALENLVFFQSERRSLAGIYAKRMEELASAKRSLDEKKLCLEVRAAKARSQALASGNKYTVQQLEDISTVQCEQEAKDVIAEKEKVSLAESSVTKTQEDLSSLKQIIEGNQTIVITTMSALKQYKDVPIPFQG